MEVTFTPELEARLTHSAAQPEAESRPVLANIRSIDDRLPKDRRLEIVIHGSNHYRFSDDGALLQVPLVIRALHTLGVVRLDGRRQIALTTHYINTFFDVYLKGAPASELKSQAEYPEIEYLQ